MAPLAGARRPSGTWSCLARSLNDDARAKGRWRELRAVELFGPRGTTAGGARVTVFASNDYLGLSVHPRVLEAARQALERWGTGSGGARLLTGSRQVHSELEDRLAEWKGTERALVFPSGYAANVGALSALAGPDVLICSDALNHASIVDGCRLARSSGAAVAVFPHGDVGFVADKLATWRGRALVVTDSVFSMDGGAAPVQELASVCAQAGALLLTDEAHAVLGPHYHDLPCEHMTVGTLSKALGSQGGFVAGPADLVDMLVNRCRPFIFTTALAPASAAAALAALDVARSAEGDSLVGRLRAYSEELCPGRAVPSPIVPVLVGSEEAALAASQALLSEGLLVPAIRPPTVAPGTSRLRVTLSAAHTQAEVDLLVAALLRAGLRVGP